MGLLPVPVSDDWSFVLDVLFCGLTGSASRYHEASNMPFWKIDKYARKIVGPNPFRAHDAIGAAGESVQRSIDNAGSAIERAIDGHKQ